MTATPPQGQQALEPVGLDVQEVMDAYAREVSSLTQRAIVSEAALAKVQRELAEARATIYALRPGAPATDPQEG